MKTLTAPLRNGLVTWGFPPHFIEMLHAYIITIINFSYFFVSICFLLFDNPRPNVLPLKLMQVPHKWRNQIIMYREDHRPVLGSENLTKASLGTVVFGLLLEQSQSFLFFLISSSHAVRSYRPNWGVRHPVWGDDWSQSLYQTVFYLRLFELLFCRKVNARRSVHSPRYHLIYPL